MPEERMADIFQSWRKRSGQSKEAPGIPRRKNTKKSTQQGAKVEKVSYHKDLLMWFLSNGINSSEVQGRATTFLRNCLHEQGKMTQRAEPRNQRVEQIAN